MTDVVKFDTLKDGPARKKLSTTALYIQSKFANFVVAKELARRHGDEGIVSVSVNPGALKSDLTRHIDSLLKKIVLVRPSSPQ
jgi:retinol dehydrogenase 12